MSTTEQFPEDAGQTLFAIPSTWTPGTFASLPKVACSEVFTGSYSVTLDYSTHKSWWVYVGDGTTAPSDADDAIVVLLADRTDEVLARLPAALVDGRIDSNVSRWRGTQPGNVDSNGFVPGNVAAINGNTGRAGTLATWTDNNRLDVAVSTRASQDSVNAIGSGQGDYSRVINVKTSGGQNIIGALVTVQQSGSIVRYGYTNSSGNVSLLLNSGTYLVYVSAFGYTSLIGQSLVVSANGTTNVSLTPVAASPDIMPGLCAVRFSIVDGSGEPVPGASIVVAISTDSQTIDDKLISQAKQTATADQNGIADLVMIRTDSFTRGGTYKVVVKDPDDKKVYDQLVRVPNVSSCSAEDLIEVG